MKRGKLAAKRMRDLMTENFQLISKDGTIKAENFKGRKTENKIITFEADLIIEVRDHILRKLSNGFVEDYLVQDPGYHAEVFDFPDHYQVAVQRTDAPQANSQTIINNLSGPNAHVNINSSDNSVNVANTVNSTLFEDIRDTLKKTVGEETERQVLLAKIDDLEKTAGTKSFGNHYKEFIGMAAAHMGVLSPFLPALSSLL